MIDSIPSPSSGGFPLGPFDVHVYGLLYVVGLAAADPACSVDVVRAEVPEPEPEPRVRSLVRGHHQLHASEFTGDHDAGREFQHRNDELMYVVDGAVEIEAEGRAYRLMRGDTMYLTGGVRHRWRATVPDTRVIVVAVAEHIEARRDRSR